MSRSERLHSLSKLFLDELREDCVERDIWCEECENKELCDYLGDFVKEYERKYDAVLAKIIEHKIAERKKQND